MLIITPQNPTFYETLENIDIYWKFNKSEQSDDKLNMIVDTSTGLLKNVDSKEFTEYVLGGEYDEQLSIMDEQDIINEICGLTPEFSLRTLINT